MMSVLCHQTLPLMHAPCHMICR